MISEREKLEFESLPEFIREPYTSGRESYVPPMSAKGSKTKDRFASIDDKFAPIDGKYATLEDKFPDLDNHIEEFTRPKHEALDTLWPGVDRDFFQPSRRSASFYLTVGFMTGTFVSLLGVFGYSLVSHAMLANATTDGAKKIVVAGGQPAAQNAPAAPAGSARTTVVNGSEVLIPAFSTYEVKTGDTLAGIAFKAYKRVSPRMLDEICKANNMRSANVLSLGQTICLPEYHPQSSKVAAGASSPSM